MESQLEFHGRYLMSLGPLVLGIVGVPTVREASRGQLELDRPLCISIRDFMASYYDLVFSEEGLRAGKWWTLLSHIFVHQDVAHLQSNLASLLISGLGVHNSFGPAGLYGVFFLSGAAAACNRWGKAYQTESQLGSQLRVPQKILGVISVPEKVQGFVNSKIVDPSINKVSQPLARRATFLGSSAAVSGLAGCGVCATVEDLVVCARAGRMPVASLSALAGALQQGKFLSDEWHRLRGADGITGIDHAGHLTGFVAGVVIFFLLRAGQHFTDDRWPPWKWRHQYIDASPPRRHYIDASGILHR
jgi:membrane associated rhomboid family serine protease